MGSFRELVNLYEQLEEATSHERIIELLANFFRHLGPEDVKMTAYLAIGTIGPKFEDIDLGIGDRNAIKAIARAYEVPEKKVESKFAEMGDLGDAASSFNQRKRSSITIRDVFQDLTEIREASGKGSKKQKIDLLSKMLSISRPLESKYIIRIACGRLRLGFGEKFLLEGLSLAFIGNRDNIDKVEDTYDICTDIGQLAESMAKYGINSLGKFSIKLGRPVQTMLAKRVHSIEELNEKFPGKIAAEEKYDGERVQVHVNGSNIQAFSRRLTDISEQFPDIIEAVRESAQADKMVLDGEIVAYNNGEFLPFQKLMQRRRKYQVEEYIEKIPVAVFFFDIIYLNGTSLMNRPYPKRRKILEENLKETDRSKLANRIVSEDFSKTMAFFDSCIKRGMEGIIIKSVKKKSTYKPGIRGWLWVKWKKEYIKDVRETFDLVIVGSYHGRGKRKGSFGALLCAVLNKDKNQYETLTKVGTGFEEKDFEELEKLLKNNSVKEQPVNVSIKKNMEPDRYIEPSVVIEVLGSEITSSPSHTAGTGDSKKGFALRFPRFFRIRYDKAPSDATTVEEVEELK
ncbi:ATP-dependent DNA ligase [Methanococcoides sp. NM1]|uniref:ATP-dependent DNA ligase n=1 Tax=Methanococcoides sp. NM1 TaxID=1201013 RepID=UPI001083D07D|nr:ATP-dependent DNA ligase [Methanococcoides sp. NM1]